MSRRPVPGTGPGPGPGPEAVPGPQLRPPSRAAARPARRWPRRLATWSLAALALLALAAAGAFGLAQRTVAPLSGALALDGLGGTVEIMLDADAVPHVFADGKDDVYVGLGFLHAQNRLWQMELMRRAGQGRLSEVFGTATLDRDRFVRTLDVYGQARRAFERLKPATRSALAAYARGVNAWLDRERRLLEPRLPPEFYILRHTPEPWQPADSLVIVKMMALQLGRNLDKEIDRLTFAALGLSPAEIEDLLPTVATWGAPPLPDIRALYPLRRPEAPVPRLRVGRDGDTLADGASNNWVLHGRYTQSGKPLLAGDPHLRLTAPSTWYLVHLAVAQAGGGFASMAGASLPGTPLIPLGRGSTFAWALTNAETDVQDLFIERLNPDNPAQYQTPDGWRDLGRETVTIRVRGEADVTLERLTTRHGPVVSSVYRGLDRMLGPGHVAALAWVALDDDDPTAEAVLFDASVRTVAQAIARTRTTVAPMQAMVVADINGATGFIAPGRVPRRHAANAVQGRAPVPGWDARYDWQGYLAFEELPQRWSGSVAGHDPATPGAAQAAGAGPEVMATTNTAIVRKPYPHHLTWDWGPPFRQRRIEGLLAEPALGGVRRHDMATMRSAQLDVHGLAEAALAPLMIAAARKALPGARAAAELERLSRWHGEMRGELAEPLVFTAWLRHTLDRIWRDDLGEAARFSLDERLPALAALLLGRPTARDWCDDRTTPTVETCSEIVLGALEVALAELDQRFGADRSRWRWGDAHFADGLAEPLGRLPMVGDFFNVRVPSSGGGYTLNRGQPLLASAEPYANRNGTSLRTIYDLADLEASLFIQSTGQSGNPFSPHYRSFAARWAAGEYITIPTRREAIIARTVGTWYLVPR